MPRDEDKCIRCNKPTVWRVKRRVYEKGIGYARCAKCNYVGWFGSFAGGTIISKEELDDYLSLAPSSVATPPNESTDPSLRDTEDVDDIPF
jgi:hypothetical protein